MTDDVRKRPNAVSGQWRRWIMDGASGTWLAADRASDAPAVRPPALVLTG